MQKLEKCIGLLHLCELNQAILRAADATQGDFDDDGDVDGNDFLKWQRGESPDPLSQSDLALWESQYGDIVPAIAAAAVVPEPSATALLLVLTGTYFMRRQAIVR